MSLGSNIASARNRRGLTQEKLAEKVGVSFQAVSTWERDENLPDTAHLQKIAEALDTSLDALFGKEKRDWTLKEMCDDPERMYTYVKTRAQSENLEQTLKALPFMREKHKTQTRKSMLNSNLPYIVHPLTLCCHALAMGLVDDDVLPALLLHDVLEDTCTRPEELPVNERVREAVRLVSYNTYKGSKEEIKPNYYNKIAKNDLASLVKCIDRCNNLSCMADGFTREKMVRYVIEAEKFVMPLLKVVKAVPAWNNAAWLLQYQMRALTETFKRLL